MSVWRSQTSSDSTNRGQILVEGPGLINKDEHKNIDNLKNEEEPKTEDNLKNEYGSK